MDRIILEGENVRLEPLSMEHLDGLCQYGLDESLWTLVPEPVQSREDMAGYIEAALVGQERGKMLPFATIAKETGEAAGSTRYGNIDLANGRLDLDSSPLSANSDQHGGETADASTRLRECGVQSSRVQNGRTERTIKNSYSAPGCERGRHFSKAHCNRQRAFA